MNPSRTSPSEKDESPVGAMAVVAVTRRPLQAGRRVETVRCTRDTLTPGSDLPDRDSPADVVVVAYDPELTAAERAAITGPHERANRIPGLPVALGAALLLPAAATVGFFLGWVPDLVLVVAYLAPLVGMAAFLLPTSLWANRRAWVPWSRAVLAAHARVRPADPHGVRREVTERAGALWGGAEAEQARRCWAELVVVATIPRPVDATHLAPVANRGKHAGGAPWLTPTALAGDQLGHSDYTRVTTHLVALAADLRAGRVRERSPEHLRGWDEVSRLAQGTLETGRPRVDWAPVLQP